jgi:hypothetical protein
MFEISGALNAIPLNYNEFNDVTSTTQTISIGAPANALVVGGFTSTAGETLPSFSGVTAGATSQENTGGSGSGLPRGAAAFYHTTTSAATVTATGTYSTSTDCNGMIVAISGHA